ncbi:hypothetical protein [Carboxylicivirga sp. RSCT41]|uniref:hypothetical protein n=1 Tax=Carboxylicivirga agarovorans TaxID=3417570 RepID=UPI003D32C871
MAINFDNIKKAIQDVSSLEVATLTNPGTGQIDLTNDGNQEIFAKIRKNLGQADLVAYTKFELDGDAVNFVNKGDEVTALVDEHALMVKSALETRKTLFDTIFEAVGHLL